MDGLTSGGQGPTATTHLRGASGAGGVLGRLRLLAWGVSVIWLVFLTLALVWHWGQMEGKVLDLAKAEARSSQRKDALVRSWVSIHGGVYVPVSPTNPPNPYLAGYPERDVVTPSGRVLTLMNPRYVSHQILEMGYERYGLRAHLASLKPTRPDHAPDPWEEAALTAFESGVREVCSVEEMDGEKLLRLMSPQFVETGCLRCHSGQGYNQGDIRGGTSFSIPMKPYDDMLWSQRVSMTAGYLVLGVIGLLGFWWGVGRMSRSIAERDRAVSLLEENEERFRLLYDLAPVAYQSLDLEGTILNVNEAWLSMLGYDRGEVIGRRFSSFVVPEQLSLVEDCYSGLLDRGNVRAAEFDLVRKSGAVLSVTADGRVARDRRGRVLQVHCVLQDVTERKRGLRDLRESETRFRSVLENVRLVAIMIDRRGRLTFCNDTFLDLTGWTREEILDGDCFELFLPPEIRDGGRRMFNKWMERGTFPAHFRRLLLTKAGDRRLLAWNNTMLRDPDGRGAGLTCIAEDITERRRVQKALREAESLYRSVIEASPDGIAVVDVKGTIVFSSPRAQASFGLKGPEDAVGRSAFDFFAPEYRESARSRYASLLRSGERTRNDYHMLKADGTTFLGELNTSLLRDATGNAWGVIVVTRDVTDRRQLEDQLRHAQKIEAVGQLAAGVAHDLNNLLSPILGYAELLLDRAKPGDQVVRPAEQIHRAGLRARDLVRQLLAFGRRQTLEVRRLDLNQVILGLDRLLRRTLRANIRMVMEMAASLPPIRADVGQLEQVVMNLAVNAQDAMPEGGRLVIGTREVTGEGASAKDERDDGPNRRVALTVTDDGCGMDPDTRERIFEPFFTTKALGKGTGLGLATVYGIVTQHGGTIEVVSQPGEGTSFTILFPVTEVAEGPGDPVSSKVERRRGSETILVVEDNDMLRDLTVEILSFQGYRVLSAANGAETLRILEQRHKAIHLLITDVIMPDMNGREVHAAVERCYPDVRVIYMSGYADEVIARHGVLKEGIAFLQKPFSLEGLAARVREVLEAPETPETARDA